MDDQLIQVQSKNNKQSSAPHFLQIVFFLFLNVDHVIFSQDSFLFQKPGPGWPAPASCTRVLDIAMSNSSAPDSKLSRSSFELVISTVYNRRSIGLLDSDVKGHTATSPQRRGTFCPRSPSTGIDLIVSCHGQSTTTWSRHWPVVGGRQPVPGAAVAPRRRAAVLPRPRASKTGVAVGNEVFAQPGAGPARDGRVRARVHSVAALATFHRRQGW